MTGSSAFRYVGAVGAVMLSCCFNVVCLEMLTRKDSGSTHLITFSGFAFIALEGAINYWKFGTAQRHIPLKKYALVVSLFYVTNLINNYALSFHISMPLHVIIRSGSLIANMVIGAFILNRSYKPYKYGAALVLTAGIITCTISSSNSRKASDGATHDKTYFNWLIGVGLLNVALLLAAVLGVFQEKIYSHYGKHPREALFYNHALPLPMFIPLWDSISRHMSVFSASAPVTLPLVNWSVPELWLLLLANTLAQYCCVRSVFVLTTEMTSLSVTLIITLRKFVSLILSVWLFDNPFTKLHWVGTGLVFVGTLVFTDAYRFMIPAKKAKTKSQ